jgi:hypothetical protein
MFSAIREPRQERFGDLCVEAAKERDGFLGGGRG